MLASMHLETHGNAHVARVVGEVDASNAGDFARQLKDAVPNSAFGLIVDLSQATYMDSSGVHMVFDLADALRRRQQVLHLVVPDDSFVGDLLHVVNISSAAGTSQTLAEALGALKSPDF